jgi:cytochrome c oxidase cbb3-type subunit III
MTTAQLPVDTIPVDIEEPAVPEALLLDHAYDGIQEYDNPLPSWWSWIFIGCIMFAGFYALYFHVVGWGSTPGDRYRVALAAYDEGKATREKAELSSISEDFLAAQTREGKVLDRGATVFKDRCASCHGPEGAGLIGPNLTDNYQSHGSTRLEIFKTIRGGVAGTAMPAWGDQLPPADVIAAATFAITLRGKRLPGKATEGLPVQPFSP